MNEAPQINKKFCSQVKVFFFIFSFMFNALSLATRNVAEHEATGPRNSVSVDIQPVIAPLPYLFYIGFCSSSWNVKVFRYFFFAHMRAGHKKKSKWNDFKM